MSTCFTCREHPAGNSIVGKNSAYCAECQPRPGVQPEGAQCVCSRCGVAFATLTDFQRHIELFPQKSPKEGLPTGRCFAPWTIGLELAGSVWGTPEGNANRARKAAGLRDSRLSRRP